VTWRHRPSRQWHYALPGSDRFACGSFYLGQHWEESETIPARGNAICVRCERLMLHVYADALSYKGQSGRKVRGKIPGASR
jgi:hypothetical protein